MSTLPLYEYQCATHGVFELMRKFSDPPLTECPTCGGAVEKLASAPAIQFKGTGWYITDYARKSSGAPAGEKTASADGSKDKPATPAASDSSSKAETTTAGSSKNGATTSSSGKGGTTTGSSGGSSDKK